jgi:hypothetical protein
MSARNRSGGLSGDHYESAIYLPELRAMPTGRTAPEPDPRTLRLTGQSLLAQPRRCRTLARLVTGRGHPR